MTIPPYAFSTTQLDITGTPADMLARFESGIDPSCLTDEGIEADPHVTVVYGLPPILLPPDLLLLRMIAGEFSPIPLQFLPSDTFPGPTPGVGSGVVFLPVLSTELLILHDQIMRHFPVTSTHPEYHPHLTIGYFQNGHEMQYLGLNVLEGFTAVVDHLTVSDAQGRVQHLPFRQAASFGMRTQSPFPVNAGRTEISLHR